MGQYNVFYPELLRKDPRDPLPRQYLAPLLPIKYNDKDE